MWGYMSGWWGAGMGLMMALFWILAAVGIVALVWGFRRPGSSGGPSGISGADSALHVLEERYARGEIGRDEFQQKKRDLGR
jgi:putative membrane protein